MDKQRAYAKAIDRLMSMPLTDYERYVLGFPIPDGLYCPRLGCGQGDIPQSEAIMDALGHLHCPRCGAVVLSNPDAA